MFAKVRTNDMHDQHPHDSRPSDTKVGNAMPSNLKHDDGHIHCASPIWGLPPEDSKPANIEYDWQEDLKLTTGPNQMQRGSIENQASTKALMRPAQSHGDRGTDGSILGHLNKVPPLSTPPDVSKGPAAVL